MRRLCSLSHPFEAHDCWFKLSFPHPPRTRACTWKTPHPPTEMNTCCIKESYESVEENWVSFIRQGEPLTLNSHYDHTRLYDILLLENQGRGGGYSSKWRCWVVSTNYQSLPPGEALPPFRDSPTSAVIGSLLLAAHYCHIKPNCWGQRKSKAPSQVQLHLILKELQLWTRKG